MRLLKCNNDTELKAAKYLRDQYFLGRHCINDPYVWIFCHVDHAHIILYKGIGVIGYIYIQFLPDHIVFIQIIIINEHKKNNNTES